MPTISHLRRIVAAVVCAVGVCVLTSACNESVPRHAPDNNEQPADDNEQPADDCRVSSEAATQDDCATAACASLDVCRDTESPQVTINATQVVEGESWTLSGEVADNLRVATASASVDGGPPQALTLDDTGHFQKNLVLAAGEHSVIVSAEDVAGNSGEAMATVRTGAPLDFDVQFTIRGDMTPGKALVFDASGTEIPFDGHVESFQWSFGDDEWAHGEQSVHLFDSPGYYLIELKVTLDDGRQEVRLDNLEIGHPTSEPLVRTVSGHVFDESGQGLEDAQIGVTGNASTMSRASGAYQVESYTSGDTLVAIARLDGYTPQTRRLPIDADQPRVQADFYLTPQPSIRSASASVEGPDGSSVSFDETTFVDDEGTEITGDIDVRLTLVDVDQFPERSPGSEFAVWPDGSDHRITLAGAAHVEFFKDGEPISITPGSPVELRIPQYVELGSEGDTTSTFQLDAGSGLWLKTTDAPLESPTEPPARLGAVFDVTRSGWYAIGASITPSDVELTCNYGPAESEDDPTYDTCFVEVRVTGWTRTYTLDRATPRVASLASGSACFRATARQGLCSAERCATEDELSSGNLSLELDCLDDNAEAITLGDKIIRRTFAVNTNQLFSFEASKGDGIRVLADAENSSSTGGNLQLIGPHGHVLAETDVDNYDAAVADEAPEDGTYFMRYTNTSSRETDVTLETYNHPVLKPGQRIQGRTPVSDTWVNGLVLVDRADATLVNAVAVNRGFSSAVAGSSLYFSDLTGQTYGAEFGNKAIRGIESGPTELPADKYHLLYLNTYTSKPYDIELTEVASPTEVTLDGVGQSRQRSTISSYAGRRIFTLDVADGDGVHIRLAPDGDNPTAALQAANFRVWYVGDGSPWSGEDELFVRHRNPGIYQALDEFQFRAHHDGTYAVEVFPTAFELDGRELGRFELTIDVADHTSDIVVGDPDNCSQSTTPSLNAAALAATRNTTVTVCDGDYNLALPLLMMRDGVTLTGQTGTKPTINYIQPLFDSNPKIALQLAAQDLTIRSLHLVYQHPAFSDEPGRAVIGDYDIIPGDHLVSGLTLENLTIESDGSSPGVSQGIVLNEYTNQPIPGATGVTIKNVELRALRNGIRLEKLDDTSITNADIAVSDNSIELYNVSRSAIRDSLLDGSSYCIRIYDGDHATGTSIIERVDCQVHSTETGISYRSRAENDGPATNLVLRDSAIKIDESYSYSPAVTFHLVNKTSGVEMTANNIAHAGGMGVQLRADGTVSEPVVLSNNVVQNVHSSSEGFALNDAEYLSSVTVINNSIRIAPTTRVDRDQGSAVQIRPDSSSYTGAVNVTVANNLVTTSNTSISLDSAIRVAGTNNTLSITSKNNLFYGQFATIYDGVSATNPGDIVEVDPMAAGPLLEVPANSPAVDAGDCAYAPATDYLGVARPQGSGCDVGAYEH